MCASGRTLGGAEFLVRAVGVMRIRRAVGSVGKRAAKTVSRLCPTTLIPIAALALSACSFGGSGTDPELGVKASPRVASGRSLPKGGGHYKVGKPYKVAGRTYVPREDRSYDRTGVASWYGEAFHGRRTANGEIFDMGGLSAAHPTLPLPTYSRVTNLANGQSVVVRISDRGPFAHDPSIDASTRTPQVLAFPPPPLAPPSAHQHSLPTHPYPHTHTPPTARGPPARPAFLVEEPRHQSIRAPHRRSSGAGVDHRMHFPSTAHPLQAAQAHSAMSHDARRLP